MSGVSSESEEYCPGAAPVDDRWAVGSLPRFANGNKSGFDQAETKPYVLQLPRLAEFGVDFAMLASMYYNTVY